MKTYNTQKNKKWKWIISAFGLIGIGCVSSISIVSCSSSNNQQDTTKPNEPTPTPPVQPPAPEKPKPVIPTFNNLDEAIKWLWYDNIAPPILEYFKKNPNVEVGVSIWNNSNPRNDTIFFTEGQLTQNFEDITKNRVFPRFKKLIDESSIIGENYFYIGPEDFNNPEPIPGYENSPLYGPYDLPKEFIYPVQLKWTRTQ